MPEVKWIEAKQRYQVIVPPTEKSGKRVRRYFKTKADAVSFAGDVRGLRDGSLSEFMRLHPTDRARLLRCIQVAGSVEAIERAVTAQAATKPRLEKPLDRAVLDLIAAKQGKRSWQYVENLSVALGQFAKGRESRPVSSITADEIETWLSAHNWSASTQLTYIRRLETFFSWCVRKGYAASNPTAAVERPTDSSGPIQVLPVRDARRLLETCRRIDPGLLPYFAIGLFAGIRPDEIKRLTRDRIKDSFIEIQADKSKTRRRRLVEIHPTLQAWLDVPGGSIGWQNWRRRWRAVRDATVVGEHGPELLVAWDADIMRHSFASYAYPIKGAQWTSNECGHQESVLFQRYRELVPLSAATAFWQILP